MQHFDLITLLPSRLSCIILQDWLSLKSVMALDSAYCCHSHRKDFVDLLESDEYFIREQVMLEGNADSKVVVRFGERLKGFDSRMIERFGEKLRSVATEGTFTPSQVRLLAKHCHNLTRVNYRRMDSDDIGLWNILKGNDHLEYLGVCSGSFAIGVTDKNLVPKLRALGTSTVTGAQILCAMEASDYIVRLKLVGLQSDTTLLSKPLCFRHLTCLGLAGAQINDETLHSVASLHSGIVQLDLSDNKHLTDEGILSVVQNLKQLQSLNIQHVKQLTHVAFVHIYTHCANTLHTLFFTTYDDGNIPILQSKSLNALLERCTQLRVLHVEEYYCDSHPERALRFLPEALKNLTTLSLVGEVCSQNLSVIAQYAVNLEVLYLYDSTRKSMMVVWNGFPRLRELHILLGPSDSMLDADFVDIFLFTMDLWMKIRGVIVKRCTIDLLTYDVMELL